MTNKKHTEALARLNNIAIDIESNNDLNSKDKRFLVKALRSIAAGEDPKIALDIKANRGQRTGSKEQFRPLRNKLLGSWIATARAPLDEGGLGLTLEEAVAMIGSNGAFGLTEETIRTYWNKNEEIRKRTFFIGEKDLNQDFNP